MTYAPLRDYTSPDAPCRCQREGFFCNQGRDCPALIPAEACTELGADEDPEAAERRYRAIFWNCYLLTLLVVLIAVAAIYWPH